jgi:hypothetical protein
MLCSLNGTEAGFIHEHIGLSLLDSSTDIRDPSRELRQSPVVFTIVMSGVILLHRLVYCHWLLTVHGFGLIIEFIECL